MDPREYNAIVCIRREIWYAYADHTIALYFTAVLGAALIVNGVVTEVVTRSFPRAPKLTWLAFGVFFAVAMWGIGYALLWFRIGA